jgi:hypothetical protein
MENLEQRIEKIEERNRKVEAEKAWETSATRKFFIAVCTYLVIGLFLSIIKVQRPWLSAVVPTVGFLLSTFTVPVIKKIWIEKIWLKKEK